MTKITTDQIDDLVELVQEKIHALISGGTSTGRAVQDAEAILDLEALDTTLAAMRAEIETSATPQYQYGYRVRYGTLVRDYWRSDADRRMYATQGDKDWARAKINGQSAGTGRNTRVCELIRREVGPVTTVEG